MTTAVSIYCLVDPDTGQIRYVGSSKKPLARLIGHLGESLQGDAQPVCAWLRDLQERGCLPGLRMLEQTSPADRLKAETRWIEHFLSQGEPLLNADLLPPSQRAATAAGKKSAKVQLIELRNGGVPFEELLRQGFAQGKSPRDLAPKFDMHYTQIYRWARSLGVAVPGRHKVTS